jgi:methyltransferase (TIGR00027 family)
MEKIPLSHVSDTAFWVAVFREEESARKDALFHDPQVSLLLDEKARKLSAAMLAKKEISWVIVMRTGIIDEILSREISKGVDTVLNLGAGLDTRPYRLTLPTNLNWIEVDYSHIIELKNQKLQNEKASCNLTRVSLDLSDTHARIKLFSQVNESAKKVLVLTEGVVPYLTNADALSLAEDLKAQDHFKLWVLDYVHPFAMDYLKRQRFTKQMENTPFQFKPAEWFGFFETGGWKLKDIFYFAEEGEKKGRPMPGPFWVQIVKKFMPAKRLKFINQLSGFAVLEPTILKTRL